MGYPRERPRKDGLIGLARQGTNPLQSRLCHEEETRFLRRSQDSDNLIVN